MESSETKKEYTEKEYWEGKVPDELFEEYLKKQDEVSECWNNKNAWNKMALLNTARSGYFSSDRSIREYCESIWKVYPMTVEIKAVT